MKIIIKICSLVILLLTTINLIGCISNRHTIFNDEWFQTVKEINIVYIATDEVYIGTNINYKQIDLLRSNTCEAELQEFLYKFSKIRFVYRPLVTGFQTNHLIGLAIWFLFKNETSRFVSRSIDIQYDVDGNVCRWEPRMRVRNSEAVERWYSLID